MSRVDGNGVTVKRDLRRSLSIIARSRCVRRRSRLSRGLNALCLGHLWFPGSFSERLHVRIPGSGSSCIRAFCRQVCTIPGHFSPRRRLTAQIHCLIFPRPIAAGKHQSKKGCNDKESEESVSLFHPTHRIVPPPTTHSSS